MEDGRWRFAGRWPSSACQSVREVIGRRVDRLGQTPAWRSAPPRSSAVTSISICCSPCSSFSETRLLDLLDGAVAASLLRETRRAERFTFTHALVEHTLYEDIGRARRTRLHKRIAEALEEQCGDELGERLGELAGHWAAAVVSTDTAKALYYARRAAERALEQLAPGRGGALVSRGTRAARPGARR